MKNALLAKDNNTTRAILATYRQQGGQINHKAVLSIPSSERLPQMAAKDENQTLAILVVCIEKAMSTMNLARPMNADQMLYLAEEVLESSKEDNLALEDLMLFLQNLIRGKYGSMYESMDVPKFMEKFELYREERHRAYKNIQEEKAASHRPDYSDTRISEQSAREESLKNVAAVIEYEKSKAK